VLGVVDATATPSSASGRTGPSSLRHLASASTAIHPPADELAAGPPPEVATAPLEDDFEDVEAAMDAEEAVVLPLSPTGPGSEFIRADALGSLQLGESLRQSTKFHGRPWEFETGKMARLADGACTLRVGNTTVLATAVCSTTFNTRRDPLAPQFEVRCASAAAAELAGPLLLALQVLFVVLWGC
jgi:hypothetical protein